MHYCFWRITKLLAHNTSFFIGLCFACHESRAYNILFQKFADIGHLAILGIASSCRHALYTGVVLPPVSTEYNSHHPSIYAFFISMQGINIVGHFDKHFVNIQGRLKMYFQMAQNALSSFLRIACLPHCVDCMHISCCSLSQWLVLM